MNEQSAPSPVAPAEGGWRYRAFISYSHADSRFAARLHRALETYRLPARLVGRETCAGPAPSRLRPIFRDRDELSAAGQLSDVLRDALAQSQFLIVVLSADTPRSKWVGEEIRQFKAMGGSGRVLAIVASDARGSVRDFMPDALSFAVDDRGTILGERMEPVAADARPSGDGFRLATLKLIAGLACLPLDEIVQRDAARRQQRARIIALASIALAAMMGVLTVLAVRGQAEAERQRAEADGLIRFMLTDLRAKLEPVGRLEVLDSVGQRALAYYEGQDLARLSADELGRRARAILLVAEVRELRGDSEAALSAYREAERTTGALLERSPGDPERMFDHAQSVFYVGQTAWTRRDWATAEARFLAYVELADRMAATDPESLRFIAEQGYAANGLGAVYLRQARYEEAAGQFQRYLAAVQRILDREPDQLSRRMDVAQAEAWLSDARAGLGDIDGAKAGRLAELGHYADILTRDPRHANARLSQVMSLSSLAQLELLGGEIDAALEHSGAAVDLARRLLAEDPQNMLWREFAAEAASGRAEGLMAAGRWREARSVNREALREVGTLTAADPRNQSWWAHARTARWMEIAIARALDGRQAAAPLAAAFRRDFAADRETATASEGAVAWTMVEAMAALDRARDGASAEAARHRAAAREAARQATGTEARRTASVLAWLEGSKDREGYPAAAILAPSG